MKWMKNLYIGSLSEKRVRELKKRIRRKKKAVGCYVLFPSTGPRNQLDLMDVKYLHLDYYRRREDLVIIGLASGEEDGIQMILRLAEDCYRDTGTADLRAYAMRRIAEEGTEGSA